MSELTCLELGVALWVVHVLVQAGAGNVELPPGYLFTSRDKPAPARGLLFGRATRAMANYVENLTPFVAWRRAYCYPADRGRRRAWRNDLDFARIVYVPIYLLGVVYVCALGGLYEFL